MSANFQIVKLSGYFSVLIIPDRPAAFDTLSFLETYSLLISEDTTFTWFCFSLSAYQRLLVSPSLVSL